MELERVAAVLRPRRSWEGLDLGCALGRTWFLSLWPLWWAGALPTLVLGWALTGGRVGLWALLVWWLKPLYEAPLVYWTSRALFGERLSLRRPWPILRAAWTRRLLPFLLWRRLSPSRSFAMPIALLEGLGGSAARARRRVLNGGGGAAGWLTLVCYHFEAILWLGLLLTLYALIPQGLPSLDLEAALTDTGSWAYGIGNLLYVLAISAIAPFYVCGGFAAYLTRRTELEAWDLDLAFRRAASAGRTAARAAAVLMLPLALALPGSDPQAADLPDPPQARALIGEILAHPDFGGTRTIETWMPIGGERTPPDPESAPWAQRIGWLLSGSARVLAWLLLALALAAVALLVRRVVADWRPGRGTRRVRPVPALSSRPLAAEREPIPDPQTLAERVRARLAVGDRRAALALLYRGGLAQLERRGARVPDGATEGECLRLAERYLRPEELAPFRRIAADWQALAYAQRAPDPQSIAARLADWLAALAGDSAAATGAG